MRILLARHGETDWNARGKVQGQSDIPLNGKGLEQARDLAERLLARGERVERLWCSPQRRAAETAAVVGARLGLEPETAPGLQEISFGIWEGYSWPEVAEKWPEEYSGYRLDRLNTAPEGGECYRQMLERVLPVLKAIAAGPEDTVLAVTHSGLIKGLMCWLDRGDFSTIHQVYLLANAEWVTLDSARLFQKR